MNGRRWWSLISGVSCGVLLSNPITANADTIDRQHCIAADIALQRGFEAMQETQFTGSDGKTYTRGKVSNTKSYDLTAQEEGTILSMADELTPGAIEYVDLWLVGPGSVGKSTEQIMTDDAQAFIAVYTACLNTFGADFSQ